MSDKSDQELSKLIAWYIIVNQLCLYVRVAHLIHTGAIAAVHPSTIRLICDFHRAQAVDRWVNRSQNGVPSSLKEVVKDMMKKLAYAKTRKHYNNK